MATKATRTKTRKPKSKASKKKGDGVFHHFSWKGLVIGCVVVVVAYVAILYYFFVEPLSFRWRAIYGEPDYPEGYEIRGIDISRYQANINWEVLRNAKVNERPLRFVIVKATEGSTMTDTEFNDNFYKARANDLIRGAYHYYKPNGDPVSQAKFFLKQVHLEAGDFPPVLDIEERGNKPLKRFLQDLKTWLDMVEEAYGIPPIIYTNLDFKKAFLSTPEFEKYPLWIANYYKTELTYQGEWAIWQYTDLGEIDGIKGKVDFNLFNGDLASLHQLLIPEATVPNH